MGPVLLLDAGKTEGKLPGLRQLSRLFYVPGGLAPCHQPAFSPNRFCLHLLSSGVQDRVAVEPLSPEAAMQKRKGRPKESMKSLRFHRGPRAPRVAPVLAFVAASL